MATRIGVDVGGTFTDLILYDDTDGKISVCKVPSTPGEQNIGVINAVNQTVSDETLNRAEFFLHGTTVGINAILERKGAKVGLLTTAGFRDVLEARRAIRRDLYDQMYKLMWKTPEPLVPRELRIGISERVLADGSIEKPLHPDEVQAAAKMFIAENVECVAIVFINAYANPEHELAAEKLLREAGFEGDVSISHQVSGVFSEYERTSTTVLDGYIRPNVGRYLRDLEGSLRETGFKGDCMITVSGGGALTFSEAQLRPFETIMSGPVAGAIGAAELCRVHNLKIAVTGDVGGTSFDTCLLRDGRPIMKYEGEVAGMPLQTPWVDVRSIGAGGGSLAWVDGGLLHVGPESAGAVPGPVCYRRGGTRPATTDAAAALGMLGFGELAGGLTLDIDGSIKALEEVGKTLGLDAIDTARGMMSIMNAAMAQAIRSVSVEVGEDPREAALIMFGGAGPLFGTLLARELNLKTIVVPNYAGNFSALGLLSQDNTRTIAKTVVTPFDAQGLEKLNKLIDEELRPSLEDRMKDSPASTKEVTYEPGFDMRYSGQEYTLTIYPSSGADGEVNIPVEELTQLFRAEYERTFGITLENSIEVVSVRLLARAALPKIGIKRLDVGEIEIEAAKQERTRAAFSFTRDKMLDFRIIHRNNMNVNEPLLGPAIILEQTTTTYIDAGFEAELKSDGTMFMVDKEYERSVN